MSTKEATKITLGKPPKTFASIDVEFDGPDGLKKIIPGVVFKYRTRAEFAKFTDTGTELAASAYAPGEGEKFSMEQMFEATAKVEASRLMQCIESWGLDDIEITEENLIALQNEYPAAAFAIWSAYTLACRNGRLGN